MMSTKRSTVSLVDVSRYFAVARLRQWDRKRRGGVEFACSRAKRWQPSMSPGPDARQIRREPWHRAEIRRRLRAQASPFLETKFFYSAAGRIPWRKPR